MHVEELTIVRIGLGLYLCSTPDDDYSGSLGLLFLFIIYAANLFGPPPPDVKAISWPNPAVSLLI